MIHRHECDSGARARGIKTKRKEVINFQIEESKESQKFC